MGEKKKNLCEGQSLDTLFSSYGPSEYRRQERLQLPYRKCNVEGTMQFATHANTILIKNVRNDPA